MTAEASLPRRFASWALRPAGWQLSTALAGLTALALLLAAVGVAHGCNHPPPPILKPEADTPRGTYCSAVQGIGVGWICFVAPLLAVVVAGIGLRRATVPSIVIAIAVSAAAVVNAFIVSDLRAIQLVPGINS